MPRQYYALMPDQQCCKTPGGTLLMRGTAAYNSLSGPVENDEACSCKANSATSVASGIESAIRSHPFIALAGAFLLGCALSKGSKKGIL